MAHSEVTHKAVLALVAAYNGLRSEMLSLLQSSELEAEFAALFKPLDESTSGLDVTAATALLKLKMMGGWINGLIEGETFEQRMRADAAAHAERMRVTGTIPKRKLSTSSSS